MNYLKKAELETPGGKMNDSKEINLKVIFWYGK